MFWRFSAGVMVVRQDAALKAAALHLDLYVQSLRKKSAVSYSSI